MPTEHRDVDVDAQLRAFAVALEARTAEQIRPGQRSVGDDRDEPVVVEPVAMPSRRDRQRWMLPAIAATVVATVLVAGLVTLSDNTTPSDTPTSTTTAPATTTPPATTTTPEEAEADTGPIAPLGHGRDGAVAREHAENDENAIEFGYVDETGAATTFPGTPPHEVTTPLPFAQDDEDGIHDPLISSSNGMTWQLVIEGEFRTLPDNTYYGAAPTSGNRAVYAADAISPEDDTQTQSVLAILEPDGSGEWWSIPDGWHYAASDAWGTVFVKIDGNTVRLALLGSGRDTEAVDPPAAATP
jgi:hypothetical protein